MSSRLLTWLLSLALAALGAGGLAHAQGAPLVRPPAQRRASRSAPPCGQRPVPRYDPENRLTQVGANWAAGYTADGLRAWKTLGGGPTFFYYDGGLPVLETDDGGNVQAVNTWGPNGLLSRRAGSTSTFYTFDLQGSVTQRLSSAGGVIDSHLFDAYGTELSTRTIGDPFAFGAQWGYYTDQASGNDTGWSRAAGATTTPSPTAGRIFNCDLS